MKISVLLIVIILVGVTATALVNPILEMSDSYDVETSDATAFQETFDSVEDTKILAEQITGQIDSDKVEDGDSSSDVNWITAGLQGLKTSFSSIGTTKAMIKDGVKFSRIPKYWTNVAIAIFLIAFVFALIAGYLKWGM